MKLFKTTAACEHCSHPWCMRVRDDWHAGNKLQRSCFCKICKEERLLLSTQNENPSSNEDITTTEREKETMLINIRVLNRPKATMGQAVIAEEELLISKEVVAGDANQALLLIGAEHSKEINDAKKGNTFRVIVTNIG